MATLSSLRDLEVMPAQRAGLAWGAGIVATALAMAWLTAWFAPTAMAMVMVWARSDTFMHGFFIAPISLWLVWRQRARLATIVPRPNLGVLVPMAAAGLVWLVGNLAGVNALEQFAFVAMIVLTVPMMLGWPLARAIAFPLAFLFFMVPFGEFLLPPLMEGTATFAVEALRATGVPVYREGLQFVVPSGKWSVVEACSGVRYLIASMVAGSLYAYLNYQSTTRRVVFFAFSILVPIVANWLRAYLIVLLGHLSNNTIAVGVDHLIYGWVFFGVVLLLLFWIGSFWQERDDGDAAAVAAAGTASLAVPRRGLALAIPALVAFAVVVAVWPLAERALDGPETGRAPDLAVPAVPAAWTARAGGITDWTPRFMAPAAQSDTTYQDKDGEVGLFLAYYRHQRDGRKLVSSDNVLVQSENSRWAALASTLARPGVAGAPPEVRETVLKRQDGSRLVVWQWYWLDGHLTASDVLAKLYGLRAKIAGRGDDGAVVILSTRGESAEAARQALARFAGDAGPAIDLALQRTRDGP